MLQDLKEAEQLLAKQKTLIKSAAKSLKKLTTDLQNKEREVESFEADLNDLLEGKQGSGNEADVLKQQQQELQQEIKEVKADLDDKQGQVCSSHLRVSSPSCLWQAVHITLFTYHHTVAWVVQQ